MGQLLDKILKYQLQEIHLTDTITVSGNIYDINGINILALTKGTTEQRPTNTIISEGFEYYDSTLKKMILWNGTAWTNLDGTALT